MANETNGSIPEEGLGRTPDGNRVSDDGTHQDAHGSPAVDELIINVLSESASPFDQGRLRRWREAAPENEEYFQEVVRVWALTAPEPVAPASGPPPVQEILAEASIPFPTGTAHKGAPGRRTHPWIVAGLLAASLAGVGLGIQVFGPGGPTPRAIYRAAEGEPLTVTLSDGSFVRLAPGSNLREWESEGTREVSLEGRGFFAVARDETRPFIVRAGQGEIRVLGTRFQVAVEGNEVETSVVEGLVRVSNDKGSVEVPAGSVATLFPEESPSAREVDDVLGLLDWPGGVLVFQATPLSRVVAEVSRHYGRTLRIHTDSLGQRRVTAWFQDEPFEAVAESLCIVTEAACRVEGEGVAMGIAGEGGPE